MTNEINIAPVKSEAPVQAPATNASAPLGRSTGEAAREGGFRGGRGGGQRKGGPRRGDTRAPRAKPEFDSKTLTIRRVTRVVSGGRRFAFSVALVAGNRKGMVGVGLGKAGDTALAIDKAMRHAKKHMIKVNLTKSMSIPHEVYAKYSSGRIELRPVKDRGLVAGSAARIVLELAGVTNVAAKIVSPSKNQLNIARATIDALQSLNLVRQNNKSTK